jgi:sporulation protein YlmC with PRC-barrel domain
MITRQFALAAVVLAAIVPALAQDASDPTSSVPLRATGGAYPARQDTRQWLGSNLIGAKVVSASNETIGRVANLVINDDGAIESVVIAVGGLLGVGAKEVAVTYRSLNIVRTRTGDAIDHVTLAATKSDMRHAAEFKTLSQVMAEARARR